MARQKKKRGKKGKVNQYHPIPSPWSPQDWQNYIPMNSWHHREVNELPLFMQNNGVTKNFNSALVGASASTHYNYYCALGYRVDEQETKMDEHAFVYIENIATGKIEGGLIDHANYPGRTTNIPLPIQAALRASGITASIMTERMPPRGASGSLPDLHTLGLLSAVTQNFGIGHEKIVPELTGRTGPGMPTSK